MARDWFGASTLWPEQFVPRKCSTLHSLKHIALFLLFRQCVRLMVNNVWRYMCIVIKPTNCLWNDTSTIMTS